VFVLFTNFSQFDDPTDKDDYFMKYDPDSDYGCECQGKCDHD